MSQREQRDEEALVAYEQAVRLHSTYLLAHESRIRTLLKLKRYRDAFAAFKQAVADVSNKR